MSELPSWQLRLELPQIIGLLKCMEAAKNVPNTLTWEEISALLGVKRELEQAKKALGQR